MGGRLMRSERQPAPGDDVSTPPRNASFSHQMRVHVHLPRMQRALTLLECRLHHVCVSGLPAALRPVRERAV
jgi:hypothetical protein